MSAPLLLWASCNGLGQRVDIAAIVVDLDRPKGPRRHRVAAADQLVVQRPNPAGRVELVRRIGLRREPGSEPITVPAARSAGS